MSHASRGDQSVQKFLAERPHVLILDVHMPVKNGFAVLEELKEARVLHGTRIFFVSADERPDDIERARRLGAHGYLVKPFNFTELLAQVEESLDAVHDPA